MFGEYGACFSTCQGRNRHALCYVRRVRFDPRLCSSLSVASEARDDASVKSPGGRALHGRNCGWRTIWLAGLLTTFLGAMIARPVQAQPNETVVAVFDLEDRSDAIKPKTMKALSLNLRGLVAASKGYELVPESALRDALLGEKKESYKQCYSESCQIEIGKALAASKVVTGYITSIGGDCTINLFVVDLKKETTETAGSADSKCSEKELMEGLRAAFKGLPGGNRLDYTALLARAKQAEAEADKARQALEEAQERREREVREAWEVVVRFVSTPGIAREERIAVIEAFTADFPSSAHQEQAMSALRELRAGRDPIDVARAGASTQRACGVFPNQPTPAGDLARSDWARACRGVAPSLIPQRRMFTEIEVTALLYCDAEARCVRMSDSGEFVDTFESVANSIRDDIVADIQRMHEHMRKTGIALHSGRPQGLMQSQTILRAAADRLMVLGFDDVSIGRFLSCALTRVGTNTCEGPIECVRSCEAQVYEPPAPMSTRRTPQGVAAPKCPSVEQAATDPYIYKDVVERCFPKGVCLQRYQQIWRRCPKPVNEDRFRCLSQAEGLLQRCTAELHGFRSPVVLGAACRREAFLRADPMPGVRACDALQKRAEAGEAVSWPESRTTY